MKIKGLIRADIKVIHESYLRKLGYLEYKTFNIGDIIITLCKNGYKYTVLATNLKSLSYEGQYKDKQANITFFYEVKADRLRDKTLKEIVNNWKNRSLDENEDEAFYIINNILKESEVKQIKENEIYKLEKTIRLFTNVFISNEEYNLEDKNVNTLTVLTGRIFDNMDLVVLRVMALTDLEAKTLKKVGSLHRSYIKELASKEVDLRRPEYSWAGADNIALVLERANMLKSRNVVSKNETEEEFIDRIVKEIQCGIDDKTRKELKSSKEMNFKLEMLLSSYIEGTKFSGSDIEEKLFTKLKSTLQSSKASKTSNKNKGE